MKIIFKKTLKFRPSPTLFLLCLMVIGKTGFSQNQKVWTGTSKLFGIDSTSNPGSLVNWSIGMATSSGSSKLDSSIGGRAIFSRFTWENNTSSVLVDSVKVNETVSGCIGSTSTKLVEVFPLPSLVMPSSNQILCSGISPNNFAVSIANYAAISGIGSFSFFYEIRIDSAAGTLFTSGSVSGITSGTANINVGSWPSMTPGKTYVFIITQFGSEQSSSGNNPSPGNLSSVAIQGLPRNYSIQINSTITPPSIQAY
jgi:hypothetical protein